MQASLQWQKNNRKLNFIFCYCLEIELENTIYNIN